MADPTTPDPNAPAAPAASEDFGAALDAAFAGLEPADPSGDEIVTQDPPDSPEVKPPAPPAPKGAAAPKLPSASTKTGVVSKPGTPGVVDPDLDEVPKGLDARAGARWKEIRADTKAADARAAAAELRAAAAEEKLKGFNPEEIEGLKKANTDYENHLAVVNVQATRQFKEGIETPIESLNEAAKILASRYEASPGAVLAALSEADPSKQSDLLTELSATWSLRDQTRLFRLGDDRLVLEERRKLILENAKTSLERIRAQEGDQMKGFDDRNKAEYGAALNGVWADMQKQSDFFNIDAEGVDPQHKAAVGDAQKIARGVDFNTLPPQGRAFAAYAGAMFPYLMQVVGGLQGENERLAAELTGFRGSEPGAGAGGDPGLVVADPDDANVGFLEGIERKLGSGR